MTRSPFPSADLQGPLLRLAMGTSLRILLWTHATGAMVYACLQPRGFAIDSRSFFEHTVIAPGFALASFATALSVHLHQRTALSLMGVLAGFWIPIEVAGSIGNTLFADAMRLLLLGSAAGLWLVLRSAKELRESRPPILIAALIGSTMGGAFLHATWAPPATVRPSGGKIDIPAREAGGPELESGDIRVEVQESEVLILHPSGVVVVDPAPEFDACSITGFWTLFDSHRKTLGPWSLERVRGEAVHLRAEGPGMRAEGLVSVAPGCVRIRVATTIEDEVCLHLGSCVRISVPDATWQSGDFAAFRNGRLELLRPTYREKGPFTTMAKLEDDPILVAAGWKIQVRGWADQASRAPSPTAGWGVSQAAIEFYDNEFFYELAGTSVGRGWHTVRCPPGTYVLETILSR